MPHPTRNAFTPNKRKRTKEPYYEDIYGTRNPDEEAQGVHICDDSSSSNEETPLKKRAKLRSKGLCIALFEYRVLLIEG